MRTLPEGWVLSPRGMRGFCILLQAAVLLAAPRAHAMPLVEQGEPRAVLVTADEPSPVAVYAADHVERYFDAWEEYAQDRPGGPLATPVNAAIAYPAEVFSPAQQILDEAMEAARQADRPDYARRVAFLKAGLEHARLTARFIGLLNRGRAPDDAEPLAEARAALNELIAFRREHESMYIADYIDASRRENRWLDIDTLLSDE